MTRPIFEYYHDSFRSFPIVLFRQKPHRSLFSSKRAFYPVTSPFTNSSMRPRRARSCGKKLTFAVTSESVLHAHQPVRVSRPNGCRSQPANHGKAWRIPARSTNVTKPQPLAPSRPRRGSARIIMTVSLVGFCLFSRSVPYIHLSLSPPLSLSSGIFLSIYSFLPPVFFLLASLRLRGLGQPDVGRCPRPPYKRDGYPFLLLI